MASVKAISSLIAAVLLIVVVAAAGVLVLAVLFAFGLYWVGLRLLRRRRDQAAIAAHDRAEMLARAEIQHRWYQDGDSRGIYGRYTPAA